MRIEIKTSALLLFAFFALACSVQFGWRNGLSAAVLVCWSLLLHECGHATVATLYGVRVRAIGLASVGGYTVREKSKHTYIEIMSSLAGPLVNLLLFGLLLFLPGRVAAFLAMANLVLGVSNLLPVPPSDGWRIWKAISKA